MAPPCRADQSPVMSCWRRIGSRLASERRYSSASRCGLSGIVAVSTRRPSGSTEPGLSMAKRSRTQSWPGPPGEVATRTRIGVCALPSPPDLEQPAVLVVGEEGQVVDADEVVLAGQVEVALVAEVEAGAGRESPHPR